MHVLILPGDGIGPEITAAVRQALAALDTRFALGLHLSEGRVGLAALEQDGTTWPDAMEAAVRAADLTVLGPVDTAAYPPPSEGGVNPSATMRIRLDLYANMRPSRALPGVPALAPGMDLLVARENTEGFYADRNMHAGTGEFMATEDVALAVRKITRRGSERIARAAFAAARNRRRKVTIVHKSNVLKHTDGLFERTAYDVAAGWPEVEVDDMHVDAAAALLVREPERFDVLLCTNMFGDILSNLAAELSGGLGLGGSINAGDTVAVAQAAHGSAPDIAGRDIANPSALLFSTAQLLAWKGEREQNHALVEASRTLESTVETLLGSPETRTADLGGSLGTRAFADRVVADLLA
ncbi:MAG: isocitrate/isopropylmalate family dehydrogenase [Gammaproteobacteria bacterium]|nr:isocitrate/isopropylmalate family dehydrogenase [Gammaproteobacteria bacterium]